MSPKCVQCPELRPGTFCTSDEKAIQVISCLQRLGSNIPRDFSIVGYGDHSFGRNVIPSLTTVSEPYVDIGATAIEIVHASLRGEATCGHIRTLPVSLIARESSDTACQFRLM